MSLPSNTLQRRALTVPALFALAVALTVTIPVWLALSVVADAVRLRFRFPIARLLSFGVCWAWLEIAGVTVAFALWLVGQGRNPRAVYALQRWWAANLLAALGTTCGIRVEAENIEAFIPGPVVLFVRHACLADSLVTAHIIASMAKMRPRFVLKRELLADPCLDIVGQRMPNHFLDRATDDSAPEIAALERLVMDMGPLDVGVIFPEGTRANASKRESALRRIGERDPERARRLSSLELLLPPRPSGAHALLRGAAGADVVFAWHIGFEGLDTFGGILRALGRRPRPVRFVARRVSSADVPRDDGFVAWLDEEWIRMDVEVRAAFDARPGTTERH